jgi:hypothetical protein
MWGILTIPLFCFKIKCNVFSKPKNPPTNKQKKIIKKKQKITKRVPKKTVFFLTKIEELRRVV